MKSWPHNSDIFLITQKILQNVLLRLDQFYLQVAQFRTNGHSTVHSHSINQTDVYLFFIKYQERILPTAYIDIYMTKIFWRRNRKTVENFIRSVKNNLLWIFNYILKQVQIEQLVFTAFVGTLHLLFT